VGKILQLSYVSNKELTKVSKHAQIIYNKSALMILGDLSFTTRAVPV